MGSDIRPVDYALPALTVAPVVDLARE